MVSYLKCIGACPAIIQRYLLLTSFDYLQRFVQIADVRDNAVEWELCSLSEKRLGGPFATFEQFLSHMYEQARAQHRLRTLQERRLRTAAVASP